MFFHQENAIAPFCYFYFYQPFPAYLPQELKTEEMQLPISVEMDNSYDSNGDEDKIILTKEDLQRQGYVQSKKPWTKIEDKLLLALCQDQNARFEEIAAKIEGRNAKMCYSRYRRLAYLTKIGWNKLEDQKLIRLVQQFGENNWKTLAELFPGKNHKQLKEHYTNYLKPELIKSEWTLEEDLELIRLINIYGKEWKSIEAEFEGRSRSQIKNRYFGKISRMNKKKMESLKPDAK